MAVNLPVIIGCSVAGLVIALLAIACLRKVKRRCKGVREMRQRDETDLNPDYGLFTPDETRTKVLYSFFQH